MEVNVSQLLKEGVGEERIFEFQDEVEGFRVEGRARLIRTHRSILAKVSFKTKAKLICSKCLEEFEFPLEVEFEEEFFPTRDVETGAPIPLPEDEDLEGFSISEKHILDLREAIRQYILLSLPMKPLCRPDCAGLCPKCGHNLNMGPCGCEREIDSRWAPLRKLLKEQEDGSSET